MKQARRRAASIAAGASLAAILIVVPSAGAASPITTITSPADGTYLMYDDDTPNTFAVSGTSNLTTGAHVDIVCYAGDERVVVASNVAVNANGTFSAPAASVQKTALYRICGLKAVPTGTPPNDVSVFDGPRIYTGWTQTYQVGPGPNVGKLVDYYLYFPQLASGMDYDSLGSCGIDDGYLVDSTNSLSAVTWYCNDWLDKTNEATSGARSEIQIDGVNAYTPRAAKEINSQATSGLPALTGYSWKLNPTNRNASIKETDAFVKCPSATFPPTGASCASYISTGVSDTRTIVQDHGGEVAWITDTFTSTNGKAHTVDLLWQNDQHFYGDNGSDAAQVEYKFPGQAAYSKHVVGDSVSLSNKPGTILVRYHGAADGDPHHGRGAIVYGNPATAATFMYLSSSQSDFTLHQVIKVPAHGSVTLRVAYIADFKEAMVEKLAKQATPIVQGCTIPNVVGKTLAAAKKAITAAHCSVGKVSYAQSAVAAGKVISESPKAGSKVDYGSKVALVVSK